MINVIEKEATKRIALAFGSIYVGDIAFSHISNRTLPKGDVLALCTVAGILGVKKTADLLPLCHPLTLDHIQVTPVLDEINKSILVFCRVETHSKTGVEMEALTGVQAALLCIYDLSKMITLDLELKGSRLLVKVGGKSGVWISPKGIPDQTPGHLINFLTPEKKLGILKSISTGVITLSDRASSGEYEDLSGQELQLWCKQEEAILTMSEVIPDEPERLVESIKNLSLKGAQLILCTGGTGISPRDQTPETINKLCHKMIPGIGEYLRLQSSQFTKHAWSSRMSAGVYEQSLVISLPGSPKAVIQCMNILRPLLSHLLQTIVGKKHD